ncbi:hypothetical protein K227x_54010 [Rubripirellula lacrimiformis]|uniref:Uncharacterized protein n=1 Tax=Rubripirellula lacrimiformis TaxID=1930273 RepID=A0A517NIL7_9BACT|nr:hypothetical protein [Rubripirellula lacrimiformis]QDT06977.1 hypothetical protein K227x_54010 [Rubripirellula lacrimiformis]
MSPKHSIDFCPVCGGGLCGIRVCGVADENSEDRFAKTGSTEPHGLIICDECEAIWLEPDIATPHQYPAIEDAQCPICHDPLWGKQSRWANMDDIEMLNWQYAVNPDLDGATDEGTA